MEFKPSICFLPGKLWFWLSDLEAGEKQVQTVWAEAQNNSSSPQLYEYCFREEISMEENDAEHNRTETEK